MTYPPMPTRAKKTRKPLAVAVPDVILGVLAVAGLVLSGWSLATLLHDVAGAPWPVAAFGVAVFDLLAMMACLLVYQRRDDPWSAAGARIVMTLALLSSSVVNGAHGYMLGGWTTAVVLAAAPLAFEVAFELRHRTLTAMIWVYFRKEAMSRLKLDAWQRIAVQAGPDIRMTATGSPADVSETIRSVRADNVRALTGGSAKAKVREQLESGVTDPAQIVRNLPDYNPETVRRHIRTLTKEG